MSARSPLAAPCYAPAMRRDDTPTDDGLAGIAVAGLGYIGRAHANAVRNDPDARLAAVVDPSDEAAAYARAHAVPWHASLAELLAADRPDGVVVATPNTLHVEHAFACIDAGVPMLLEKPVAPTVAEAGVIARAANAAGARVLIGHHRAHSPVIDAAREVIASGALGRLVCVNGSATFYKPDDYFAAGPWRREIGAGPILLNLIHEVHNLRTLCGEIVAVQALSSNRVRGFAVEDTAAITLAFADAARSAPSSSRTRRRPREAGSRRRARTPPTRDARTRTATSSRAPAARSRCRRCG